MADRKPLKVLPDGGGDSAGLSEFVAADTIGVVDGGTGLATVATSNILTGNGTSALTSESTLTFDGTTFSASASSGVGTIMMEQTGDNGTNPDIKFFKNRGSGNAAAGIAGTLSFTGLDAADNTDTYAQIRGLMDDVTSGGEDGSLSFFTNSGGTLTERMRILSGGAAVLNGTSTTDIADFNTLLALEGGGTFDHPVLRIDSNATNKSAEIHLVCPDGGGSGSGSSIAWYEASTKQAYLHYSYNGNELVMQTSAGTVWSIAQGGTVCSGDFNDTCDRGLKENIEDIASGVSIINQLQPRTFKWKNEKADRGDSAGFIAQELKEVLPDLVDGIEYDMSLPELERHKLSVKVQGIVAYLTKAVQELDDRLAALEAA